MLQLTELFPEHRPLCGKFRPLSSDDRSLNIGWDLANLSPTVNSSHYSIVSSIEQDIVQSHNVYYYAMYNEQQRVSINVSVEKASRSGELTLIYSTSYQVYTYMY